MNSWDVCFRNRFPWGLIHQNSWLSGHNNHHFGGQLKYWLFQWVVLDGRQVYFLDCPRPILQSYCRCVLLVSSHHWNLCSGVCYLTSFIISSKFPEPIVQKNWRIQQKKLFPYYPTSHPQALRQISMRYTGAAPPLAPFLDGECDFGRSGIVVDSLRNLIYLKKFLGNSNRWSFQHLKLICMQSLVQRLMILKSWLCHFWNVMFLAAFAMPTPFSDGGNEDDNVYVSAVMVKIMSVAQREEKAPSQKTVARSTQEGTNPGRSGWSPRSFFAPKLEDPEIGTMVKSVKWLFLVFWDWTCWMEVQEIQLEMNFSIILGWLAGSFNQWGYIDIVILSWVRPKFWGFFQAWLLLILLMAVSESLAWPRKRLFVFQTQTTWQW